MKIIGIFLISLLMAGAVCAEQRLWDIHPGDSCGKIPEIEKALGSIELAVDEAAGASQYSGMQGGEKATIEYLCHEGRLAEQKVVVATTTREAAYRFANAQKTALSNQLGEPIHDGLALGTWDKLLFGFKGADLDYLTLVVVWGSSEEDIMLLIREAGPNLWEVSISQGSSKMEYILNS